MESEQTLDVAFTNRHHQRRNASEERKKIVNQMTGSHVFCCNLNRRSKISRRKTARQQPARHRSCPRSCNAPCTRATIHLSEMRYFNAVAVLIAAWCVAKAIANFERTASKFARDRCSRTSGDHALSNSAGSSNGRIRCFEHRDAGSIPAPAAPGSLRDQVCRST